VYHVGTGQSRTVREGLDHLIRLSGRTVVVDERPTFGRGPVDSRAAIERIVDETGWRPRVDFFQSLTDLWASAAGGIDESRPRRSVA
jgi:nucleoside-diphosphate-sugar epimerase